MKYYKTLKCYKAPNFVFSPETMHATSYRWYDLFKKINGQTVLNSYAYSNTTIKHIHKMRKLAKELNIKIDLEIQAPSGLQNLDSAVSFYFDKIQDAKEHLVKPRIRQTTKEKLAKEIVFFETKLKQVQKLKGVK